MIMKKLLLIFICALFVGSAMAQSTEKERMSFKVEVGFGVFSNSLNRDAYLDMNYPSGIISGDSKMKAFNLKFTAPTRYRNLDLIFGAMAIIGQNYDSYIVDVGGYDRRGYQYLMNGGGGYAGISPKWKTKYFGLTSDFAVGIFPIKEYASAVLADEAHPNFTNVNQNKASVFGAMASVGFYVNVWRIGINPTFNVLYAGGAGAGFFLYGFMLPLTITF